MAETTESKLRGRWLALAVPEQWYDSGDDAGLAVCHDLLVNRYGDPRRAYHNQLHLLECLEELDAAGETCADPATVALALWFHDAVYDPTRGDNEAASADLAAVRLAALGEPTDRIARVRELVLDTTHRDEPATPDGRLIVDVDLSILGKSQARFDNYDAAIRAEYAHVPDAAYRAGRATVLRQFLDRPTIFRTPMFVERYEHQARENLTRAVARLG